MFGSAAPQELPLRTRPAASRRISAGLCQTFVPKTTLDHPISMRRYQVHEQLGGVKGLSQTRKEIANRGLGLVLDLVPNHVAPDHPWVTEHPERFVQGSRDDLAREPGGFIERDGRVLANGRDPYFPAWPDVVQLNAFSQDLRAAVVQTLRTIGD